MLQKITLTSIGTFLVVLLTAAVMSDTGRAGKTGSPGETTCVSCHADFALNSGTGSISLSGISGSYVPGTTYSLSLTVSQTGKSGFGFGCEALNSANTNAGTFVITNSTETQILAATVSGVSRNSVTHKFNGGATPNTHTFQFNWTAPAAGTGAVTFYFAGVAGDWDGSEAGDNVYSGSIALSESSPCTAPAQPGTISGSASVCSGQSQTYSVTAVSGATDYIWTLPSGWSGTSTSNSITVSTGTTSGNITVAARNSCGTSTNRTLAVTTNNWVTPTVSIASSSGTTVCSGSTVTFTATPVNGGTTPTYQWRLNGALAGTNSPTFTTSVLTNGSTVSCMMTSNASCLSTSTSNSNTLTMSVTSGVTPALTITSGSGTTICSGSSVTFTASPVNGGSTPSYQWKVNGVNAGTNSATFTTSALTNGSAVSCVLTSNASCATTTMATSNTVNMSVTSGVTPSLTIASGSGTTICSGSSATFSATPVNGGTAPSYQWKVNGVNAGNNSATFTTSTLTNGSAVSCIMTSNSSCATTLTATSNTVNMSVTSGVTPALSIASGSGTTICSGSSVTFTASPVNGGTTPSYQWKVNGVNAGTNSATFTTSTLTNGSAVSCVLTSNASCATTTTATSNTVNMSVTSGVTPALSIASGSGTTICSGSSVTFTASPVNGGSTPSYQWKVNGLNAGANSATFTTSTLTNGSAVSCVMTSNSSCATTSTATSNTLNMVVTTGVTPSLTIASATGTTICSGTGVSFTSSATYPGNSPSYQWMVNGINVGTNSPTYFTNSLNNGDQVSCQMTSSDPCATTNSVNSQSITMTVTPPATASINASGSTSFCPGGQVLLEATAGDSYLWSPGGSTAQSITVTNGGSYFVTVWTGACSATSSAVAVTVYPVPAVSFTAPAAFCSTDPATALTGGQPSGGTYAGSGVSGGMFDPSVTGIGTFTSTYSVTTSDGCASSATADLVVNDCSTQTGCGAFVAFEQKDWGNADPTGVAPAYLSNHFATAFPNGLAIGDCGRVLRLTTATAVTDFLPSNGYPKPLSPGTLVDPTSSAYSNAFAGELVALALNITFDSLDPAFSPSGVQLKDAYIARGPFSGWTVMELYNEANHIIGCVGTNSYVRRLTNALEAVNGLKSDNGDDDEDEEDGYIVCPGDPRLNGLLAGSAEQLNLNVFPNPANDRLFLNYEAMEEGVTAIRLFDVQGKQVFATEQVSGRAGEFTVELDIASLELSAGVYVVRILNADRTAHARFVVGE